MQAQTPQKLKVLIKRKLAVMALVVPTLLVISSGCGTQTTTNNKPQLTPSPQASGEKAPLTLTIVSIPATNDAPEQLRPLTEYLTKTLKRPVSIQPIQDYNRTVDLLVEEKVQVAVLGPLAYIEAKQRNPQIEPIVAPIHKSTGRPWYKSAIVANSASGIKTLDDLKGKRLGFVSKLSTSGYMYPAFHLLNLGFNLDSDFASVQFFKNRDNTMAALLDGQVDAIATNLERYTEAKEAGKINDSYQVIWESEPIPESPIVVSQKLSPQLIAELKAAFLSAPIGILGLGGVPSNGYTLVQDSDYDGVKRVKKKLDEKSAKTK